ncbi:hypothetical protein J2X31_002260 [Flavobacterium arsenatis]|uniref:Lipoprotein n=1 Tax=Flavobacterium arsenatis TaxID=1484332 RepID=A0ABU1TR95_9FLAO|nr:hypothetical protein [Flavobacterium arsenatis]MDR6968243.1 hypothetical protein [Flavobacterium arsenatis]
MRNSNYLRLVCAFLALYILNCSIDTSDLYRNGAKKNLSINHQESVAELIIEKVLGFENAIPEMDDSDAENHSTLKKTSIADFFILPNCALELKNFQVASTSKNIGFSKSSRLQTYFEIHSPPPEI